MQLGKLSIATCIALASINANAEDYVNVQVLHYNENNNRVSVVAPSLEINKEFGTDYTFNLDFVNDTVSGASPTYYDSISGASAYNRGIQTDTAKIKKGNIEFHEQRNAISINLITRMENRDELQTGINVSDEKDFRSTEVSGSYLHYLDTSKNKSLSFSGSYQNNQILIYLKPSDSNISSDDDHDDHEDSSSGASSDASSGASQKMKNSTYNFQSGFSQVIDKTSVFSIGIFYTKESGYLSSPYHNIVRNLTSIEAENKPNSKTGYGLKIGYQKAISDTVSSQLNYKYYSDDWNVKSNTLNGLFYYDITNKLTIGAGIRYYKQTKANFYAESFTNEKFASSDERIMAFNALTYKANIDYKINEKLSYNFDINLYKQNTGLGATSLSTGIKYKF